MAGAVHAASACHPVQDQLRACPQAEPAKPGPPFPGHLLGAPLFTLSIPVRLPRHPAALDGSLHGGHADARPVGHLQLPILFCRLLFLFWACPLTRTADFRPALGHVPPLSLPARAGEGSGCCGLRFASVLRTAPAGLSPSRLRCDGCCPGGALRIPHAEVTISATVNLLSPQISLDGASTQVAWDIRKSSGRPIASTAQAGPFHEHRSLSRYRVFPHQLNVGGARGFGTSRACAAGGRRRGRSSKPVGARCRLIRRSEWERGDGRNTTRSWSVQAIRAGANSGCWWFWG